MSIDKAHRHMIKSTRNALNVLVPRKGSTSFTVFCKCLKLSTLQSDACRYSPGKSSKPTVQPQQKLVGLTC